MTITGQATIHGRVNSVSKIQQKCKASLDVLPNQMVNMVVPHSNTSGGAIWSDYCFIYRDREDAHSAIRPEWLTLKKDEQDRLNVFAAETLYDVLELAIIAPPGMYRCSLDGSKGKDAVLTLYDPCLTGNSAPVYPPQSHPMVAVAHTIYSGDTALEVGLVECYASEGTGQVTYTNFQVRSTIEESGEYGIVIPFPINFLVIK